jgi:hypothetical protein
MLLHNCAGARCAGGFVPVSAACAAMLCAILDGSFAGCVVPFSGADDVCAAVFREGCLVLVVSVGIRGGESGFGHLVSEGVREPAYGGRSQVCYGDEARSLVAGPERVWLD